MNNTIIQEGNDFRVKIQDGGFPTQRRPIYFGESIGCCRPLLASFKVYPFFYEVLKLSGFKSVPIIPQV